MAESRIVYDIIFEMPPEHLIVAWPRISKKYVGRQLVATIQSWDYQGEPCPTDSINAPYSNHFGLPFKYVNPDGTGYAAIEYDLGQSLPRRVSIELHAWGRDHRSGVNTMEVNEVVITGVRRGANGRAITYVNKGIDAQ